MAHAITRTAKRLSTLSTVLDGLLAFRRGRPKQGLALLGAAALSTRFSGVGTVASLALRLLRRR
ncbi:hypothetical protein ACFQGT_08825 [Natrialbaceae archaeon GCM10025810]|uniref:hypothetical protein n=1 Tax=Halovalidus salilacus TaxID=3075124 RepID=UPI003613B3E1